MKVANAQSYNKNIMFSDRRQSHFSATVPLFCDSVDRALRKTALILDLSPLDNWPAKDGSAQVTTDWTIEVKIWCKASGDKAWYFSRPRRCRRWLAKEMLCSKWTAADNVAVRWIPKSLTEMICSIPGREAGEIKLRATGRLKTISLVLYSCLYLSWVYWQ